MADEHSHSEVVEKYRNTLENESMGSLSTLLQNKVQLLTREPETTHAEVVALAEELDSRLNR